MDWIVKRLRSRERGAALIIVLAFVVLFAGLGVAYLSRTTSDRQVADSSFNQSNVDQLAQSAMDNIIGDLRQEILNGSGNPSPTASPVTLFVPTTGANMVPRRNNTESSIANLIRRSLRSEVALWPDSTVGPAVGSRASSVNATTDVSANGRSVSLARWNSHYLVPKQDPGTGDSIPINAFGNVTPDWVFVRPAGAAVITQSDNSVIGRYAYAIYDEGGLVDMNAAGYPSPTTILQYGRKGSLAFADLTALAGFSTTSSDNVVGWRNYASSQPTGTLDPPGSNLSFSANATNTYYNFVLSDPTNIALTNYFTGLPLTYFTNSFLTTSQAPVFNNQTDQPLPARQELLKLRSGLSGAGIGFVNSLQHVGTFSRESLSKIPQWTPTTPDSTNPNFQTLLVTGSFTRNDGTTANVGEYLVNRRFLLQRLNWLTYKGPSATVANGGTRNAVPTSAPAIGTADYDLWLLTRSNGITFALTGAFLQQGTAANILKYFGLAWDTVNQRWNYVGHNGSSTPIDTIATFGVGGTQAATRELDFFELLRAGILDNSIANNAFSPDPTALPIAHQQSKMLHVLAIGANLITQSRVDSYPVRIACSANIGGNARILEAVGMPRLPYVSGLAACPVGGIGSTGGVNWLLVPNLWDPFRDTWDLTEANSGNSGNGPNLTPGYLRPPVRITVSGNLGFGTAAASQSGSVAPASLTTFATTLAVNPALSLTLATGNSTFGRDGLLEASRLGTSDFSSAPGSYITTTSPLSAGYAWNQVVRPPRLDGTLPGTTNFVVFRVSLPGGGITTTGQNPVLILKPGFQIMMEYQSPNGNWYPYSFLQGNRVTDTAGNPVTDTWISSNLNLATTFSQYQRPTGFTQATVVNSGTSNVTRWDQNTVTIPGGVTALAQAPMFAKADPRSIRYNSQIGVVSLASPPMSVVSAGIIGPIWPNGYSTPPPMIAGPSPAPTPAPNANPATYSQVGDNGPAGSNPYSEATPASETDFTHNDPVRPVMMNRPFRSVGEMGYAFRDQPFRTLSFSAANSPDAGLLDLFSVKDYSNSAGTRGGVVSLNSRQAAVLAGVLSRTIRREDTPRTGGGNPSPSPSPLESPLPSNIATSLLLAGVCASPSPSPLVNRADLAALIAPTPNASPSPSLLDSTVPKTQRESIARALGEVDQTRTWNLLIDVIAQSGRYPPNATSLQNGFVVAGEQHYWVHVAIDRFTNRVIDKQIEVVNE